MQRGPDDVGAGLYEVVNECSVRVTQLHGYAVLRQAVGDAAAGPEGDVSLVGDSTGEDEDTGDRTGWHGS